MTRNKPILAALQIEDHRLNFIVGQFFNDVLYILYRQSIAVNGCDSNGIYDEKVLVEAIKKVVVASQNELKTAVNAVVLSIPAYRFKKEKRTFDLLLAENKVRYADVNEIIQNAYNIKIGNDLEIINVICSNYKINGITYPKIPLNEKSEMLSAEVDLLCGDKSSAYDLVRITEKAGLKVLNIYQDEYAACYEAALFEQSFNNYIVNIHLEAAHTVYSLIYKGRVISGFSDAIGYNQLIKPLMKRYGLTYKDANRLLFRYGIIGEKTAEERIINRWNEKNEVKTITYKDIQESIYDECCKMTDGFYTYCSKIISAGTTNIFITGSGANLQNLQEYLTEKFNCQVKCYCPDILGCRDPKWTTLLGMLYIYKDDMILNNRSDECMDSEVYEKNLFFEESQADTNLTGKLKNFTDKIFVEKD